MTLIVKPVLKYLFQKCGAMTFFSLSGKDTDWFIIQGHEELGKKSGAKLQTRLLKIPLKRLSSVRWSRDYNERILFIYLF